MKTVQYTVTHVGDLVHGMVHIILEKTQLRILDQNVTGTLYCEILEQDFVPQMPNHFDNSFRLIDDNAAPHTVGNKNGD